MRFIIPSLLFLFLASCQNDSDNQDVKPSDNVKSEHNESEENISFRQLKKNDKCQITSDSHDGSIDWSVNDNLIIFESSKSGKNNLYQINLNEINLRNVDVGIYVADYLLDSSVFSPITQLTLEKDREIENPITLPGGEGVVYYSYLCNDDYECSDYDLRFYNFNTQESSILFKAKTSIFELIDSNRLIFVSENNKTIKEFNIATKEIRDYVVLDFPVYSINVTSNEILLLSEENVYAMNKESNELEIIYSGEISGTKLDLLDGKLLTTLNGPASGFIDLKTQEVSKLFDTYDYEPSLSSDGEFVAAISESAMGILVKRIK